MTRFLARRLLQGIVVIAFVSVLTFVMSKLIPGDEARAVLGPQASVDQVDAYRRAHGLDQSIPVQYVRYLGRLVTGDLGRSITYNVPVTTLIGQRLPKSMLLVGIATLLALVVAIPIGVVQGARRNTAVDYVLTVFAFVFYAMPVFLLGVLMIMVFAIQLRWLPPTGPSGNSLAEVLSQPRKLVLPVVTLALLIVALFSRYVRASVIDNLSQDYVRTARAKGIRSWPVLARHVLPNSLSPMTTMVGLLLPGLLAGTMITEYVFNYPGLGLMFYDAVLQYDFAPMLAVILTVSIATVIANIATDVLYGVLDPRVRDGMRS